MLHCLSDDAQRAFLDGLRPLLSGATLFVHESTNAFTDEDAKGGKKTPSPSRRRRSGPSKADLNTSAVYLGGLLPKDGNPNTELSRRIGEAGATLDKLSKVWKHANFT